VSSQSDNNLLLYVTGDRLSNPDHPNYRDIMSALTAAFKIGQTKIGMNITILLSPSVTHFVILNDSLNNIPLFSDYLQP
jgi:hypothetical protein